MNTPTTKPIHAVAVRELVEFVWRRGDLETGGEFVGSERARAGIRGHQKIQRSRPAGYQTEIAVEHVVDTEEFTLLIRGRIDGLLATAETVWLEEIKTLHGSWNRTADPLHWAQAKIYGYLYAQPHALPGLDLQLTYLELATNKITELRETFSSAELAEFFSATTTVYLDWLREQHCWRLARDASIRALAFPFPAYRPGQRELAVVAYRTLANGGRLFLAAPTGIGKTISVLFPAIKALGEGKLERLFYLTARTIGRTIAEKALTDLRRGGLKLRSVTLTAKEKICVRDGHPCDALTCPLALGYYDRIRPALREALAGESLTRPALEAVAQKHQVCPFELSLDASVWCDAVIGDYNYVFDPQVYLRRHFAEGGGQFGFLVDEAHNLVDRAREMFSAELDVRELAEVRRVILRPVPRCASALAKLIAALRKLGHEDHDHAEPMETSDPTSELNLFPAATAKTKFENSRPHARRELPEDLPDLVQNALGAAETWLARNEPAEFRERLLGLYFNLLTFQRTAELFDERYVLLCDGGPAARVRLFCLDPSHLLRQALTRGQAAVFFSATLTPLDYFRAILGGAEDDPMLQLASPFPPGNLAVLIHDRIQTHFKGRADSLPDVVAAIATFVQARRGNYLVYFPSYQYLNVVLQQFQTSHPTVKILAQSSNLDEAGREAFLAAFAAKADATLVGFAVLGGVFGEGIDLIGERLIGAVIVGVGLPQLCVERDLIRDYFQTQNGAGFDYAYTFPGMNRVLQAIGRVIRSETDCAALLLDTRFGETRYRRLFPAWWKYQRVRNPDGLRAALGEFWKQLS